MSARIEALGEAGIVICEGCRVEVEHIETREIDQRTLCSVCAACEDTLEALREIAARAMRLSDAIRKNRR